MYFKISKYVLWESDKWPSAQLRSLYEDNFQKLVFLDVFSELFHTDCFSANNIIYMQKIYIFSGG